jgi:hypothetical protein
VQLGHSHCISFALPLHACLALYVEPVDERKLVRVWCMENLLCSQLVPGTNKQFLRLLARTNSATQAKRQHVLFGRRLLMAGCRITPILGFWPLRVRMWEFLRLWTGFELLSSCPVLPCYAPNRNQNILDFMSWHQIDLGAQDLNGSQRPKYF